MSEGKKWSPEFEEDIRNWLEGELIRYNRRHVGQYSLAPVHVEIACHLGLSLGGHYKVTQDNQVKVRWFNTWALEFSVPEHFSTFDSAWGSYWLFLAHEKKWRVEVGGHHGGWAYLSVDGHRRADVEDRSRHHYHPNLLLHELFFRDFDGGTDRHYNWLTEAASLLTLRKLNDLAHLSEDQAARAHDHHQAILMLRHAMAFAEEGNLDAAKKALTEGEDLAKVADCMWLWRGALERVERLVRDAEKKAVSPAPTAEVQP